MIAKVRLTHSVDVFVKGDNEEQITDWMMEHTPSEAVDDATKNRKIVYEDYDEEWLCEVDPNGEWDIDLT